MRRPVTCRFLAIRNGPSMRSEMNCLWNGAAGRRGRGGAAFHTLRTAAGTQPFQAWPRASFQRTGRKSVLKNSASEGEGVFSRMPTRPFARAVLWADSIVRAVLAFLCFVDSRTTSLFHKRRRIASIQKRK